MGGNYYRTTQELQRAEKGKSPDSMTALELVLTMRAEVTMELSKATNLTIFVESKKVA